MQTMSQRISKKRERPYEDLKEHYATPFVDQAVVDHVNDCLIDELADWKGATVEKYNRSYLPNIQAKLIVNTPNTKQTNEQFRDRDNPHLSVSTIKNDTWNETAKIVVGYKGPDAEYGDYYASTFDPDQAVCLVKKYFLKKHGEQVQYSIVNEKTKNDKILLKDNARDKYYALDCDSNPDLLESQPTIQYDTTTTNSWVDYLKLKGQKTTSTLFAINDRSVARIGTVAAVDNERLKKLKARQTARTL